MNNPASIALLGLTDDEIEAIALKHVAPGAKTLREIVPGLAPYQQSWQFQRIKAFLVDALAARRAPVAVEREDTALPPLPRSVTRHRDLGDLWDAMAMHQYAVRYAELCRPWVAMQARATLESAPVAGEAPDTYRNMLLEAVHRYGNARAMAEHDIKQRGKISTTVAAILDLLDAAPQASAEPLVRYCPGCGSVGLVEDEYRDCCPDGGEARMIPAPLAEKCRDTFKIATKALLADAAANEAMANQAPTATEEYTLRAMARNYTDRHTWDKLDSETIVAAADEIRALRGALAARAQPTEHGGSHG